MSTASGERKRAAADPAAKRTDGGKRARGQRTVAGVLELSDDEEE